MKGVKKMDLLHFGSTFLKKGGFLKGGYIYNAFYY
jgi:hypothetical protein